MAAVQCDNFVGNAWKKDLCLNCFKSKEEHLARHDCFQNVIQIRLPDPPKEGILKRAKTKKTANKVIFLTTEFEVIGFGGDDSYSDDEEDYPDPRFGQCDEVDDGLEESEEEKAFQKLTKTNTDYNSIAENLQEPKEGEIKKVVEPLKLGKQVYDDKGNKKTLLVSVTPFGNNGHANSTPGKARSSVNGIVQKTIAASESKTNGHAAPEICREKPGKKPTGAFAEKTEAMTNGRARNGEAEKTHLSNGENVKDLAVNRTNNDKSIIKRSQPLDKNFKFRLIKDLHREQTEKTSQDGDDKDVTGNGKLKTAEKVSNLIDKAKEKVNQFPVIADNSNFKFKTKVFGTAKVKSSPGVETNNKAVVLDMYNIVREKEDVKASNQVNEEKSTRGASEIRAKFLVGDQSREPKLLPEKTAEIRETKSVVAKAPTPLDRTKLVPNVSSLYRHQLKSLSPKREEVHGEPVADSMIPKPLMNGVVSSTSPMSRMECTFEKSPKPDNEEQTEKSEINGIGEKIEKNQEVENIEKDEENEESSKEIKFKKISIENFDNMLGGEEIILFSTDKGVEVSKAEGEDSEAGSSENGEPDESVSVSSASSGESPVLPALPSKPPPPLFEARSNFLHDLTSLESDGYKAAATGGPEKPKIPAKPILIQSKRTNFQTAAYTNRPKSPSMEKFLDIASGSGTLPQAAQAKVHPPLQETLSSDSGKNQKRPAPKPPSPMEDPLHKVVAVLTRDEEGTGEREPETKEDTPKRISRSTENLLEFLTDQGEKSALSTDALEEIVDSSSRRSLSLSQDNLMPCEIGDGHSKKKLSRGKFFLQKLLHLGKPKEGGGKDLNLRAKNFGTTASKPKPEIIHPSDLTGSRVEVVPPARTVKSRRTSSSASSSSGEHRESDVLSDSSATHSVSSSGNDSSSTNDQTKKPPPPPRAHSLDTWNAKPARPPPPKTADLLRQSNSSWCNASDNKPDNHYVNLGEARSGLAPNKPIRTGSLREAAMDSVKRIVAVPTQPDDSDYESFIVSSSSPQIEDNLYECVQTTNHRSSLPECDSLSSECPNSGFPKGKRAGATRDAFHRRSEGNVDLNSDCFKMKFLRSVSLPYCASETESEIYSPYSFYGSELGEDDYEVASPNHILRMSRLKLKKGRSIVHKNLEDNYGAVVVANHEALAQVAEQMRQGPSIPPPLRALTTAVNLRWTDFAIAKDVAGVVVERRVFYPALWGVHHVTLSLMAEQGLNSSLHAKGPFNLNPIAELNDLVPASYLPMLKKESSELIQASISILVRLQIETIESYGRNARSGVHTEESKKEVNFVLLQIINALKSLQAQGIEEASKNLTNLAVCREEKDPHPRICITDSFDRSECRESLCRCLIHAIEEILPPTDLTPLLSSVLQREKAVSLSQAKGILEFVLWGPADISFGNSNRERESALQRWLDLERATVLHGLVRTRAELTVFEEWQLLFLVRTSAKIMAEASLLLECGIVDEGATTP